MRSSFRRRLTLVLARASLMLAGLFVLSTAEARAGCHYPWVKPPALPSTLIDLKILDEAPGLARSHGEPPVRPGPSPCARGACSPAPTLPASSSDPLPRRAEFWGLLIGATPPVNESRAGTASRARAGHPSPSDDPDRTPAPLIPTRSIWKPGTRLAPWPAGRSRGRDLLIARHADPTCARTAACRLVATWPDRAG